MSKQILSAVNFLREKLHNTLLAGAHATASTPLVITETPKPKSWDERMKEMKNELLAGDDLRFNQDGTPSTTRLETADIVFDNMFKHFNQVEEANRQREKTDHSAANVATLYKVLLPVVRRVLSAIIAYEIIGVQAMRGPVVEIDTLRVQYPAQPGFGQLRIGTVKEVVEARTRMLAARWTFETAQDHKPYYDANGNEIDIEAEIMAALAQEITAEIDQEIITKLIALPGMPTSTFDMSKIMAEASEKHTFVGDVHAVLADLIIRQANLIAARTRRGKGNWCVVSPTALTILQSATTDAFVRTTEGVFEAPTNTKFVGTLDKSMNVYVNQYAADRTPVLVGYKGKTNIIGHPESDAAAFFCPYQPLVSSGVVIDPQTFEPVVSFMTRYGYLELPAVKSSLGKAEDYLGLVGIETNTLGFI